MKNTEIALEVKKKKEKKKKKEDAKNSRFTIIKNIFIIVLFIAIFLFVLNSSLFNIKSIEVSGNTRLSSNKIITLSSLELQKDNIFRFSKRKVKELLMENAYIESVKINRRFPTTVFIEIEERIPTYMLQYTDSYVYINNQGYMLEISNDKIDVPIIVGFVTDLNSIKAGNRLDVKDLEKMNIVIKIYETAKNVELSQYITKIDISDTKEYKIGMEELGKTVYLGDASNLNSKMLELKEILHKTQNKEGTVFLNVDLNTQRAYFRQSID